MTLEAQLCPHVPRLLTCPGQGLHHDAGSGEYQLYLCTDSTDPALLSSDWLVAAQPELLKSVPEGGREKEEGCG